MEEKEYELLKKEIVRVVDLLKICKNQEMESKKYLGELMSRIFKFPSDKCRDISTLIYWETETPEKIKTIYTILADTWFQTYGTTLEHDSKRLKALCFKCGREEQTIGHVYTSKAKFKEFCKNFLCNNCRTVELEREEEKSLPKIEPIQTKPIPIQTIKKFAT